MAKRKYRIHIDPEFNVFYVLDPDGNIMDKEAIVEALNDYSDLIDKLLVATRPKRKRNKSTIKTAR